ncbi:MAG TPA: GNAT family N-acetyltransferase, partial [Micromonosporaceae bacterium]|nr:GNAT family N-acetyltransferase [Micromonosporaceae bacterium]
YVRPARPDDAAEIARIQLATWRIAYQRMLPRHVLDEVNEDFLRERWLEAVLEPPTPRHRVLIAVEQAAQEYLVGFLASGPEDDDHDVAGVTELLVEPRWGRRGHGSRLLAASVDLWRSDGLTEASAWVFEADAATNKFLTSAGWAPDGEARALDVDDLLVPQVHLHCSLTDSPDASPDVDQDAGNTDTPSSTTLSS